MSGKGARGGSATGVSPSPTAAPSSRAGPSTSTAQQGSSQDLTSYLGMPLRLTIIGEEDEPAIGLLFAHDPSSGLVILETGAYPYPNYPSKAAAAPTTRRHQAVVSAIGGFSRRDPTGFRLIKERTIKEVTPLNLNDQQQKGNGAIKGLPPALPKKISEIQPVNVAIAEKREMAASKEAALRAAKIGVGVSDMAQEVFEALSKTLPCRWHDKHIIVMDEVVLVSFEATRMVGFLDKCPTAECVLRLSIRLHSPSPTILLLYESPSTLPLCWTSSSILLAR